MNREVHVRVWERAEVKSLRATRQNPKLRHRNSNGRFTSISGHNAAAVDRCMRNAASADKPGK
jgi:hypothetical protein